MESIQISPAAPSPLVPTPSPGQESYRFGFHGGGGAFFFLLLKNVFLTMVTLGIYAAWAKTARRKFIWSNVEIHGQRLVYTGTGREIFIAYLKLIGVYAAILLCIVLAGLVSRQLQAVVQLLLVIPFVIVIPYAVYWSRAYLLSRTTWRGIRFGLVQGSGAFARAFLGGYLLTIVTFGFYGPFWSNNLRRILTNNARFGSEPFRYDGQGADVFWISLKGVLLSIVTLGIYWFWMFAALQRYYMQHTTFSGARGKLELTGATVFGLFLLNLFGTTLTLGLAFPWISVYTVRTVLEGLSFEGHIDFDVIGQSLTTTGAGGDVLAGALDVGLGI